MRVAPYPVALRASIMRRSNRERRNAPAKRRKDSERKKHQPSALRPAEQKRVKKKRCSSAARPLMFSPTHPPASPLCSARVAVTMLWY